MPDPARLIHAIDLDWDPLCGYDGPASVVGSPGLVTCPACRARQSWQSYAAGKPAEIPGQEPLPGIGDK